MARPSETGSCPAGQAPTGLDASRFDPARDEYAAKLSEMSDDAFVKEVETQVWLSAFASNNPRAPAHKKCDATYAEAERRERPWLYKQGWNNAYESCGYTLSDEDRRGARPSLANQEQPQ